MKGLFLQTLYGIKASLIGTAAFAIASAVFLPLLINAMCYSPDFAASAPVFLLTVPLLIAILPLEGVGNDLGKNVINKFSAFSVTVMTPAVFSLTVLLQMCVSVLIGAVMCLIPLSSVAIFCEGFDDILITCIKTLVVLAAAISAVEYVVTSLMIKLKNRDKAAMVCMGISFAAALIAFIIIDVTKAEIDVALVMNFIGDYWYAFAVAFPVVLFPVGFALMNRMIKRGELA